MRIRPQVAMVATQQFDYFELVLITMKAFPRGLQSEWEDYIRNLLARTPYIRSALVDND